MKHSIIRATLVGAVIGFTAVTTFAEEGAAPEAAKAPAKPPPLPFHCCEGGGGIFSTQAAYLVNPEKDIGLPSFGAIYVHMNHGRGLVSLTATETLGKRVELGYAYMNFDMGDLPDAIEAATETRISDESVDMHVVNARLMLLSERQFGKNWIPAVTVGLHYKNNATVNDIDGELAGTLTSIGIADDKGLDYTIHASKMFTNLPRPVIVNLGLRSTEGAHTGLLGFTDDRKVVFEGSVAVLATSRLILGAEYRQKPDEYTPVDGLIAEEDDWWTVEAGYIINPHMTIAVGYAQFGNILNHKANDSFGAALKIEL